MTIFDPDPNVRWLFAMTHPDDEISVCCWIKRLVEAGATVYMSWTHDTPVRQAEGREAAKRLGVPESNLRFMGFPDGEVVDHLPELMHVYRDWLQESRPDRVCCGAFEQGHLDHDATNYLINRNFEGPVLEIPFYHAYLSRVQRMNRFATLSEQEVLMLTPEEQAFKKQFAKGYPSTNIRSCLLWYEVWQLSMLKPVELAKTERMRVQTHYDFLRPNLPEALRTRVEASERWAKWVRAIQTLEAQDGARTSKLPVV